MNMFSKSTTIALLALGWYWLDQQVGTLPLFLIVGVVIGFAGGFVSLLRKLPQGRSAPPDADR